MPLSLHEDAGPYTKVKSANVLSFHPLLGLGSERETNFTIEKNEKFQFDNCWCAELAWEPDAPTASHWRWLYKAKGPWESGEDARRDAAAGRRGATAGIIA